MQVCAVAGGVGSARFCSGLLSFLGSDELTIVVNTGDDERIRGLHVSPDIDTVLYHLAASTDWDRGWGISGETFVAHERYREIAGRAGVDDADLQAWFALGDRDLATHQLRTRLLDTGKTLTEATQALTRAFGIGAKVLPATNDRLRTIMELASGERVDFQDYFVKRGQSDEVTSVSYAGAAEASPAPGTLEAIEGA
ncbi:MAG: 2-phospho-L-lactate transferase CofD family protein, partial [candidate division Zixibacteria bacterium]|nr:2-phospho-L-lactate transferase CofD family protein [candidate division Zixibacteria bacterium]